LPFSRARLHQTYGAPDGVVAVFQLAKHMLTARRCFSLAGHPIQVVAGVLRPGTSHRILRGPLH
jgi:hypothetical protein